MAGWPQQDHDKRDRAKIAHELDRREFWKSCFLISLGNPCKVDTDIESATSDADAALSAFEQKFPPLHGAS